MQATIYLIPIALYDDETALNCIPSYIINAVKNCNVFYAENERTSRRFLKKIFKDINIDAYEWHTIHKAENEVLNNFKKDISQQKTIGIMSEAGCPGIADPGQILVHVAQQNNAKVIPLVGPNSITLALMASGMNGQSFQFVGYLPVDTHERKKKIIELENESIKKNCTQIFIETPYRNNYLLNDILITAKPETLLCIGVDITSSTESIKTKKVKDWKKEKPELHKRPAIFLLYAGS
ncbi:MAG: SAM-dependent methyltransferase [Parafilimonas sp.]